MVYRYYLSPTFITIWWDKSAFFETKPIKNGRNLSGLKNQNSEGKFHKGCADQMLQINEIIIIKKAVCSAIFEYAMQNDVQWKSP
jgi:hypothetical protein